MGGIFPNLWKKPLLRNGRQRGAAFTSQMQGFGPEGSVIPPAFGRFWLTFMKCER
jgi:hypothetical protein